MSDLPGLALRRSLRWTRSPSPAAVSLSIGCLAFVVYLWQLSVPEFIAFYDTGVYMAASIHLVSGVLPYRSFTFVNPPGILLLMSPVAVIARIFGSHDGLIVARVVTSFVTALNASLLAWLLRHRGRFIMLIAGVGLAILPIAYFVSSDLKLDPYSICFVLLGSIVVLSRESQGEGATTRALVIGGLLFGFAAAIKLWAFFPFLALAICLIPQYRRRVLVVIAGAAAGFAAPCLPFFVLSPGQFINQVFTVQLDQRVNPAMSPGVLSRLTDLTGVYPATVAPTGRQALVIFAALLCFVGFTVLRMKGQLVVDLYLFVASLVTVVALLLAPAFQTYYAYYAAPFLVGAVAVAISTLAKPAQHLASLVPLSATIRRFLTVMVSGIGTLTVFALVMYSTTFYTNYVWFYGVYSPYLSAIDRVVPTGSCVVYDFVIYGVYANRLASNEPDCPTVVDPYGMWQDWGYHLVPPSPKFTAEWRGYFEKANYVVLNSPRTAYIPWSKSLSTWFAAHYRLIYGKHYVFVYRHELTS